MTEEYKKLILDYLTGKIQPTAEPTDEVVLQHISESWDLGDIISPTASAVNINGIIKGSNNYILYGEYDNIDPMAPYFECGFIVILDNDFNVISSLTKYDSETYFRGFSKLEKAEDNTYYGVDIAGTYTPRFIMLNNFTIPNGAGNYVVKLRTSYNFSDSDFDTHGSMIFKNPNSAHYIFVGMSNSTLTLKAIELKVNVGEANEWTSYTYNVDYMDNAYVNYDNEDRVYIETLTNSGGYIKKVYKDYTSSTFTTTNVVASVDDEYIESVAYINSSNFYYIYNRTIKNVGSSTIAINQQLPNYTGNLIIHNGYLYIIYRHNTTIRYQRYTGTWKPISILPGIAGTYAIFNEYNMLKIISVSDGGYTVITEDFNPNNYNSYPYVDVFGRAVFPQKARLYTSGDLEFARNDYNITALGNTFTTTVEVPNVYLNSGIIAPSQLIGRTNQILINNTTPIEKNIYERVYLNFITSINAYDEDTGNTFDTTNVVKNISGTGRNYGGSFMRSWNTTKDGVVIDSGFVDSITTLGRLTVEITITYTPTQVADKLNFVNSGSQVYGWIDISNCIPGTTYTIKQKVRLADIPLENQNVLYNDNQIQFNGNDVVYYTSI